MCVLSHCRYLMETNLSQIIVYNPMGEFFIYIYIYILGVGEDIPSGASLWIFYCKGCVTVNLSGCYRRDNKLYDKAQGQSLCLSLVFIFRENLRGSRISLFPDHFRFC